MLRLPYKKGFEANSTSLLFYQYAVHCVGHLGPNGAVVLDKTFQDLVSAVPGCVWYAAYTLHGR